MRGFSGEYNSGCHAECHAAIAVAMGTPSV